MTTRLDPGVAWDEEEALLQEAEPQGRPREGIRQFLKQRLRWGLAAEEQYDRNVFLTRSSQRQEDYITGLNSRLQFAHPKGDWLYGGGLDVDHFRHLRLQQARTDYEWRVYGYYTPIGRYRLVFSESYAVQERLVQSGADLIRRFAQATRQDTNTFGVEATYDLNDTNAARFNYAFRSVDEQSQQDAVIDSSTHGIFLGLDHDLTRRWVMFAGYTLGMTRFSRAPDKDSTSHGVEVGTDYDLDPSTTSELMTNFSRRTGGDGSSQFTIDLEASLTRLVSDRVRGAVSLKRQNAASVGGTTDVIGSNLVELNMTYELNPLINVRWDGNYLHSGSLRTGRRDQYGSALEFAYPLRPNISLALKHTYFLAAQEELHNHTVSVEIQGQVW